MSDLYIVPGHKHLVLPPSDVGMHALQVVSLAVFDVCILGAASYALPMICPADEVELAGRDREIAAADFGF